MKFIEINDNIVINKEYIVCIEKKDNSTYITTVKGSYETKYPYKTLIKMMEIERIDKDKLPAKNVQRWEFGNQHWAG